MPSIGSSPMSDATSGCPQPAAFGAATRMWSMRRSRSRLAAANGLSFDQVVPRSSLPDPRPHVAEHDARNRHRPLPGEHAQLVAVGIGVEVAEQHRGEAAGSAARARSGRSRRPAPDGSRCGRARQLRCAQNTWIGPRGPSTSASTTSRSSPSSSATPPASRGSVAHLVPARSANATGRHCPSGHRRVRGSRRRRAPCSRARRRAPPPGCGGRPPTPPAGRRCRRRRGAGSR